MHTSAADSRLFEFPFPKPDTLAQVDHLSGEIVVRASRCTFSCVRCRGDVACFRPGRERAGQTRRFLPRLLASGAVLCMTIITLLLPYRTQ